MRTQVERARRILAVLLPPALAFGGLPALSSALAGGGGIGSADAPAFKIFQAADVTPPTTTISGTGVNAGWVSRTSVTFSLSARDTGGSGVDETFWRLNQTGAFIAGRRGRITAEGTTTVEYYSIDHARNVEPSKIATIQIDRSRPTLTSDRVPYYPNTALIRVSATDTLSGVASMYYRLDGARTVTVNATTSITIGPVRSPGAHTLGIWANDRAGNVASSVLTFTVGPTAPTTRIAFIPAGYVQNTWSSSTVAFTLSATSPSYPFAIAGTRYRVDGSVLATYTGPVAISTEGTHTVEYWSVDVLGNKEATRTATVKVDKSPPVSASDAKATYDDEAVINISSADPLSGVASVHWSLDDGALHTGTRTTTSVPGTHTLEFWAVDRVGNKEATKAVVFNVLYQPVFLLTPAVHFMTNTRNPVAVAIQSFLMEGALPVAGRRVVLEYSSSSDFTKYGRVFANTNAAGWFWYSRIIRSRTYFRVRFEGDGAYRPALSPTIAYVPRVALSAPSANRSQHAGRAFTVRGSIYPAHTYGTGVKIERYLVVGGKRWYHGSVWARVVPGNSYAYTTRLTLPRGTWQLRAVAPYDVAHARSVSGYRTVVVR